MNGPSHSSPASSSRRFLLLPEDGADTSPQRPQVRRYRLASIGRRSGLSGTDLAMARIAGELLRAGRAGG
ncbi:MAG TPA: hypothetical protein VGI76_03505 [Solirubrobacteraceae bacterium]